MERRRPPVFLQAATVRSERPEVGEGTEYAGLQQVGWAGFTGPTKVSCGWARVVFFFLGWAAREERGGEAWAFGLAWFSSP